MQILRSHKKYFKKIQALKKQRASIYVLDKLFFA